MNSSTHDRCSDQSSCCTPTLYTSAESQALCNLARERMPIFLTRPLGFGTSALLHRTAELFTRGSQIFSSLTLQQLWIEPQRPVLFLDFNQLRLCASDSVPGFFRQRLTAFVRECILEAGLLPDADAALQRLPAADNEIQALFYAVSQLQGHDTVAVIIDHYDAPVLAAFGTELYEPVASAFTDFYFALKDWASQLRFLLIAGNLRFISRRRIGAPDIFRDLTYAPQASALTGFTLNQLTAAFKEPLQKIAYERRISLKDLFSLIEQQCGNYRCCPEQKEARLHPQLTLQFLGLRPPRPFPLPALMRLLPYCDHSSDLPTQISEHEAQGIYFHEPVSMAYLLIMSGLLTFAPAKYNPSKSLKLMIPNERTKAALQELKLI